MKRLLYLLLFIMEMLLTPIYYVVHVIYMTCYGIKLGDNIIQAFKISNAIFFTQFVNGLRVYKSRIFGA